MTAICPASFIAGTLKDASSVGDSAIDVNSQVVVWAWPVVLSNAAVASSKAAGKSGVRRLAIVLVRLGGAEE
jgi:hypothetical protein